MGRECGIEVTVKESPVKVLRGLAVNQGVIRENHKKYLGVNIK